MRRTDCSIAIQFDYLHSLATPRVNPPLHKITLHTPLIVDGEVILRFGFLEGSAIVQGKRVVYDPQSPFNAEPFWNNGSVAESLVIVANESETIQLGHEPDALSSARKITREHSNTAVIVKMGSRGCYVVTKSDETLIPAYQTGRVYGIGSGDIFSTAIALCWGRDEKDLVDAATFASMAAARYCHTRSLSLIQHAELLKTGLSPVLPIDPGHKVYLAGPFFNIAQRWLVEETRDQLMKQGLNVFSPLHDVGIGPGLDIAEKDLRGLEECDRVLALLDGADLGTVFEIGYARKLGIPVIALVQQLTDEQLKMVLGSGCEIAPDLATAIYRTAWSKKG
ncbi:PfkB family carbohydrate kinase [Geothrix sp. PMB-07]|uniref:PfkB family carbohydrate kinase n=1 Tax=Geothrix sp. PMB-07 TaxID=3068640 RepID=UPI002741290E|nr:PfkB family carbohydrate kinase [Geothrix sp. PMB-07]WLT30928.1 PfkB family carbohydrate kinase [Geothrix sp. PMB-07]